MRRAPRRGFTLVELAIVISVSAVLVPAAYQFVRSLTARADFAHFQLDAASTLRAVSEQLELDRLRVQCSGEVKWSVEGEALTRTASPACGGQQVFARGVLALEREAGGARLVLTRRVSLEVSHQVELFVPGVVP